MYAIRIALMPIAICVLIAFSGCVNLDAPPPILKSHRVVVNFTNQGLSALSDIPMGAYRIPQSQVIVSGYQQGGVNFGLVNGINHGAGLLPLYKGPLSGNRLFAR
jgi:hypothetical protein